MEVKYLQRQACTACDERHHVCISTGAKIPEYDQAYAYRCPVSGARVVFYPGPFKMVFDALPERVVYAVPSPPPGDDDHPPDAHKPAPLSPPPTQSSDSASYPSAESTPEA